MKSVIVFCLLSVAALALARPEEHYTDRYDKLDLEQILKNPKILKGYVDCILDLGRCTPEGKELKGHMQEAIQNECAKCTEPQKNGTRRVIGHLVNHEPEHWKALTDKYDPEGKYTAKYEKELREIKG